jgi:hypothetical protein
MMEEEEEEGFNINMIVMPAVLYLLFVLVGL